MEIRDGTQRNQDVLGLQKSLRVPRLRSGIRAPGAVRRARAMDSVPAPDQGSRPAQRLLRLQGEVLLPRRAPLGQAARNSDPRTAEGLRYGSRTYRRPVRRIEGPAAGI